MSIRIGNTVYIQGMKPVVVEPWVAESLSRIGASFEVSKETLDDLVANKPGGIIRVGRKLSS